jgi:hypothetical protein
MYFIFFAAECQEEIKKSARNFTFSPLRPMGQNWAFSVIFWFVSFGPEGPYRRIRRNTLLPAQVEKEKPAEGNGTATGTPVRRTRFPIPGATPCAHPELTVLLQGLAEPAHS